MSKYFVKCYFDSDLQSNNEYENLEDACEFSMSEFTKNYSSKSDLKIEIFFGETLIKKLLFLECFNNYDSIQRYFLEKIFN
jgi:hypothetical protein